MSYMKFTTKVIVLWINQRKFYKTLEMMTEDWDSCADNEIYIHEMIRKAKLSNRINIVIVLLQLISAFTYCVNVILVDVDVTDHTSELLYIHRMELPFDENTKRTYKIILLTQTVICIMVSMGTGVINSLLVVLVLHVGGQMNILCYCLMNFATQKSEKKHQSITTDEIIQRHQKIINFSKNVEKLFTYIALVMFMVNSILIYSLAFVIVSAIGTPDAVEQIVRSIFFFAGTNLEAFVFCFAGEYLNNKSKAIGNAAYNTAWYNLKPENSRILSFIILRSQKQLTLTVGKMVDLSLEYFTSSKTVESAAYDLKRKYSHILLFGIVRSQHLSNAHNWENNGSFVTTFRKNCCRSGLSNLSSGTKTQS
ncbi:PREDICTED: LOW QUALITY PROTEIN: odorant receptor 4-like [Atta cephalotes]|uniref:Odorant receptor n=1 Tax=Atta cephalotes TaxID=12957 RepID=A0A158NVE2_ATTCE|nr:PREDICTED: LOW QUALITY PROTEIN: odorant receptor 4-like [Atta cephalotes]